MNKAWVFTKYIFKSLFMDLFRVIRLFNFPKAWLYISIVAFIVTRFIFKAPYADGFLIILVLCIIWQEYVKGDWMHEYRENLKKKAKEQNEAETKI